MRDGLRRLLVVAGLVAAGGAVTATVSRHEDTIAQGRVVFLELAPVDPRSLMQGDYMALRFRMSDSVAKAGPHGRAVVAVDGKGIGTFRRVHGGEALAADEALVEYRVRKRGVRIVTDAFYFQERTGAKLRGARYGELRVRADGEALLVGLRGPNLEKLRDRLENTPR